MYLFIFFTLCRTNLPKESMAFPDFPFEDRDGRSFVHHTEVLRYLVDYAKYYDIYKYIKVSMLKTSFLIYF